MNTDDLDLILQKRHVPQSASNLEERIKSAAGKRKKKWNITGLWHEFEELFVIPNPAYAFAATVIIGLLLGAEFFTAYDYAQQDWMSFLYLDEGEWL